MIVCIGQCNAIRNYPYQEMAFKRLKQVLDVQFQHNPQQRTRVCHMNMAILLGVHCTNVFSVKHVFVQALLTHAYSSV